MGEEAITSGRQKALREAMILLDLAITRSRGNLLNAGLRSRSGVLESGQSRAWQLTTPYGAANDDAHKEVTAMWSKLFGGGEGLPREKVDAVLNVMSPDTVVREVELPGDLRDRAAGTMKQSVMSNKTNIYLIYY
jgi:hypothetical protein